MTMIDPVAADRMERSRRRAVRILTIALSLAGLFCVFLFFTIISPPSSLKVIGKVDNFPVGTTVQIAVPRLNVSDTLQNRQLASEDPLFVTQRADGAWRVILGWDSQTGCIVQPSSDGATFTDVCSGHVYDADGYLISENGGLRLGSLPVQIEGEEVRVRDQFLPDTRP
jgi:hypothetical protein